LDWLQDDRVFKPDSQASELTVNRGLDENKKLNLQKKIYKHMTFSLQK